MKTDTYNICEERLSFSMYKTTNDPFSVYFVLKINKERKRNGKEMKRKKKTRRSNTSSECSESNEKVL